MGFGIIWEKRKKKKTDKERIAAINLLFFDFLLCSFIAFYGIAAKEIGLTVFGVGFSMLTMLMAGEVIDKLRDHYDVSIDLFGIKLR